MGSFLHVAARGLRLGLQCGPKWTGEFMVDDTGIEPVTPSMSTKCSTAELIIHFPTCSRPSYNEIGRGQTASGVGSIKGVEPGIKGFRKKQNSGYPLRQKEHFIARNNL